MDRKVHWQKVYETKAADAVSWFRRRPPYQLSCWKRQESVRRRESSTLGAGIPASWISSSARAWAALCPRYFGRRTPEGA